MERLEKSSGSRGVVTLQEAKVLIKEDADLVILVYDYWLNKRLKSPVSATIFSKQKKWMNFWTLIESMFNVPVIVFLCSVLS